MQLNKSFLAIGNGWTDRITDICDPRVAFATENAILVCYVNVSYGCLRRAEIELYYKVHSLAALGGRVEIEDRAE